ncbi:MAG: cell wall-binding repeat-containing protein [Coriobacteriales bacterium]|jgi:putative cell wall-binding protein/subtilisin family serine protease
MEKTITGSRWRKAVSVAFAVILTMGLCPTPSNALEGDSEGAAASGENAVNSGGDSTVNPLGGQEIGETDGQILVEFEDSGDDGAMSTREMSTMSEELQSKANVKVVETVVDSNDYNGTVVKAEVADGTSVEDAAKAAQEVPGVKYAQPNYIYHLMDYTPEDAVAYQEEVSSGTLDGDASQTDATSDNVTRTVTGTDDPDLAQQYYLGSWEEDHGASVTGAWQYTGAEDCVTIAVLDTGIYVDHEDLKERLVSEYMCDVYSNTSPGTITSPNNPTGDLVGHGTHVAGIAAATADNGIGIAGASYNARVLPIKVFDNTSYNPGASTSDLVKAYDYLIGLCDDGSLDDLHVVNMSLGGYGSKDSTDEMLEERIGTIRDEYQVVTVCAGGNGDSYGNPLTAPSWPSDYDECVAVTCLSEDGSNTYWSDYNKYKDISAPGYNIYSTYNAGSSSYTRLSGTSMASPLVSGCFALMWAANPDLTVDEATSIIYDTCNEIDPNSQNYHSSKLTGSHGAIDIEAAVQQVASSGGSTRIRMTNCTITNPGSQFYTGEEVKPSVTVTYQGQTLEEGVDYRLVYTNNVEVGTAKVAAAGMGKYIGRVYSEFKICYNMNTANIVLGGSVLNGRYSYTGQPVDWSAMVFQDGKRLTEGTEYSMHVEDSTGATVDSVVQPGRYVVKADGINDWLGECSVTFDVVSNADKADLQSAVDQAEELLSSTNVSDDGTDVYDTEKWVTPDESAALEAQVQSAKELIENSYAKQADIDIAHNSLTSAIDQFESSMKAGTRESGSWSRLAGSNRYKTSQAISQEGFSTSDYAVVATGDNFPDALSASALAGAYDCPIVLTTGKSLSDEAKSELSRMKVQNVIVVGGSAAVSSNTFSQIEGMGIDATRISGSNRQDTALKVYEQVKSVTGGEYDTVVVATGKNFADALSIAPYAYANNAPVILTNSDGTLTEETAAAISSDTNVDNVVFIGGSSLVKDSVRSQIGSGKTTRRLWGSDRYETSLAVAKFEVESGMSTDYVAVTTGGNFPDALAGSALCGSKNGILVLCENSTDSDAIDYLSDCKISQGYVLGSTGVLSESFVEALSKGTGLDVG